MGPETVRPKILCLVYGRGVVAGAFLHSAHTACAQCPIVSWPSGERPRKPPATGEAYVHRAKTAWTATSPPLYCGGPPSPTGAVVRRSRSALHIHVLVCRCSDVRQFDMPQGAGGGHETTVPPKPQWSGVELPLSLKPRLPQGLHCSLSASHVLVAIGPQRSPFVDLSLPPWLGSGFRTSGFWALSPGHFHAGSPQREGGGTTQWKH